MDWDLQAIVGCTKAPAATVMDNSHLMFFQHLCPEEQDDLLCNFREFSETTTVVDELEELYKPFYPPHVHVDNNNPLPIVANSLPIPDEEVKELKPSHKAASRCKKSKKQQKNKRVVTAADGVSDPWAWRKYGQKPIKGSAYPRSYYRCSSSKGCLARKHVERSQLDPGVLIVTYTAEHSDPHPTCKNSQQRNNSSTTTIAPATPRTHDGGVEDEHEQIKELKKEEDFVEADGWFPSIEVEELKGLALDDRGFLDSTWFVSTHAT